MFSIEKKQKGKKGLQSNSRHTNITKCTAEITKLQ